MALYFPYVLGKDEAVRANYICRPIGHLTVANYELYLIVLLMYRGGHTKRISLHMGDTIY